MKQFLLLFPLLLLLNDAVLAGSINPQTAVSEHNKWRNTLNRGELGHQPRPDPFLADMYWDAQLAESAQSHTDKCVWEHSGTGGENLYAHSGSSGSLANGIERWVNEQIDYNFEPINLKIVEIAGHYTQVVWDNSLRLGCAASQCSPLRQSDGTELWDGTFYACQYRESGNFVGQKPYSVEGKITSSVEYTSPNQNLDFQLLNVNGNYFRAQMKVKSFKPFILEIMTFELLAPSRAHGLTDIAYFNGESIIIPRLSIDGTDRYSAILKHKGNLLFEAIETGER